MRYLTMSIIFLFVSMMSFRSPAEVVTGTVVDDNGKPVVGATVLLKNSKKAVVTDTQGRFSIEVPVGGKAILVINAIGYTTQEVKIKPGNSTLNIRLKMYHDKLEEVVVTGYATSKSKRELNYSLSGYAPGLQVSPSRVTRNEFRDVRTDDRYNMPLDREGYDNINENRFLKADNTPLSTFSIDVDAASYSNIRRILNSGILPPAGAVRTEEMINYFKYDYPQPEGDDPFFINTELSDCPWNNKHKLLVIGLQGKEVAYDNLPASNLVFLVDVSGSMMDENKLPLVKRSLSLLVDQLRTQDKVSLVVYAGNAGLVLPPTSGERKTAIKAAIENLQAGGSTAGGQGIELAYKVATEQFLPNGNNRVILCTDGDFNVGVSSDDELERLIEKKRESGVFLTVLGFGMGNYQDAKMQKMADKGNGNHAYIDNFNEARKVFVKEFGGTLFTIAKDVKLQLEFNPQHVQAYRLIGYENRVLNKEDFNNDKKDAGDLGSGHTVTALYEIIPVGVKSDFIESVDPLKYQKENNQAAKGLGNELLTIKLRYKQPREDKSQLIVHTVIDRHTEFRNTSDNFRFAAAVAEFAMLLRDSEFRQSSSWEQSWEIARNSMGKDKEGYRSEFLQLIRAAQSIAASKPAKSEEPVGMNRPKSAH